MSHAFFLEFTSDVKLIEQNKSEIIFRSPSRYCEIRKISIHSFEAFKMLYTSGAYELELIKFYFFLEKIIQIGFIQFSVLLDKSRLATCCLRPNSQVSQIYTLKKKAQYVLSPFAFCHMVNGKMLLDSPLSHSQVQLVDWRAGALVTELSCPKSQIEIAEKITCLSHEIIHSLISLYLNSGMLLEVGSSSNQVHSDYWNFHDLLFHSESRLSRRQNTIGKLPTKTNLTPSVLVNSSFSEIIELYQPDIDNLKRNDNAFTFVQEERKSFRNFGKTPITLEQLGEFLYRSARAREVYKGGGLQYNRPYPSAGGCYCLALYLVVYECDTQLSGFFYYCPYTHQLGKISEINNTVEALLKDAAKSLSKKQYPQILIILSARFAQVMPYYQSISYSLILKEVGCLLQTMYLVATAMDLAGCALGGGDSNLFSLATNTDCYSEASVGEFILGSKPLS